MVDAERSAYAESVLDEAFGMFPTAARPRIVWRGLRVSAGLAYFHLNEIRLSHRILLTPERVRSTLLHEYAHLLAFHRVGRKGTGHGPAWQLAMRDLGEPPIVRHQYDVERNTKRQQVTYRCARCGMTFARSRRLAKGRRYAHVQCGGVLKLVSIEPS